MMKLTALLLASAPFLTTAFPTAAGACPGGMAAVNAAHLDAASRTITTGTLADGMVEITVNDAPIGEDGIIEALPGIAYTIKAKASGMPMRGVLMRLEQTAGVAETILGALEEVDTALKNAGRCEDPVVGLDHVDNEEKTEVSAMFQLDMAAALSLDVTVVMANTADTGSIYYYSNYTIANMHPSCNVCGDGKVVSEPDVVLSLPLEPPLNITCESFFDVGMMGAIAEVNCTPSTFVTGPCVCVDEMDNTTETASPTMSPDTSSGAPGVFTFAAVALLSAAAFFM